MSRALSFLAIFQFEKLRPVWKIVKIDQFTLAFSSKIEFSLSFKWTIRRYFWKGTIFFQKLKKTFQIKNFFKLKIFF